VKARTRRGLRRRAGVYVTANFVEILGEPLIRSQRQLDEDGVTGTEISDDLPALHLGEVPELHIGELPQLQIGDLAELPIGDLQPRREQNVKSSAV
jgi:hypothetical protein